MRSATATSSSSARKTCAHRHRLQRLLGDLAQHGRRVEPDLGALGRGSDAALAACRRARCTSCSGDCEVGVAEPLDDDAVDVRDLPVRPASRPSTRTIVPMPTGESSAVQKWNSCGVFGRRSVATTRPSGAGIQE